ncbi:hypothetical protein KDM41_00740 [bacterium]|nr:hypothetical protein [bacterium]
MDTRTASPIGRRALLGAGVALLLLVLHGLLFRFVIDDAFISFRYARNLVAGEGLVFNPGERVEGYSNLLYVLLSAAGLKLGCDPLLWGRIWSTAAAGALLALLPGAVRALAPDAGPRGEAAGRLAQFLVAATGAVACWMLGGLETVFFAAFAVAAWRGALARDAVAAAVAGVLLVLTRPEGPGLAVLFLAWALLPGAGAHAAAPRRRSWAGPAILLGGLAAFLLWRHQYFGLWLPNTYYAKTGDLPGQLRTGWPYAVGFLLFYGLPLAAAAAVALRQGAGAVLRRRDVGLSFAVAGVWLVYATVVGGDSLGMYRFLVPVLPVLTTTVAALFTVSPWLARRGPAAILTAVLVVALLPASFAGRERRLVDLHRGEANLGGWILAGDAMAAQLPPGSTIALGPAGYIPWATGFRTWDFYGIIEPHIAHQRVTFEFGYAGHEKHDGAYIVSQRPDYILIGNVDITDRPRTQLIPPHRREVDIVTDKRFQAEYEQIHLPVAGGKYLNLFRRKP